MGRDGGMVLVGSSPGMVAEAEDCGCCGVGGGGQRDERSELKKASMTEELSSVQFMVGGNRYSVIPVKGGISIGLVGKKEQSKGDREEVVVCLVLAVKEKR